MYLLLHWEKFCNYAVQREQDKALLTPNSFDLSFITVKNGADFIEDHIIILDVEHIYT